MPRIQKFNIVKGVLTEQISKRVSKIENNEVTKVLVGWIKRGSRIIGGLGYKRINGDEDIVSTIEAKKLEKVGLIKIKGDAKELMKDRIIVEVIEEGE